MVRNYTYDKSNPFLYTIDVSNHQLEEEITDTIKTFTVGFLLEVPLLLFIIITSITYKHFEWSTFILSVLLLAFSYIILSKSVKKIITKDIDLIKYDDGTSMEYKFLNNEKLFRQINDINKTIGKVLLLKELISLFNIFYIVNIAIKIIQIMIFIFK